MGFKTSSARQIGPADATEASTCGLLLKTKGFKVQLQSKTRDRSLVKSCWLMNMQVSSIKIDPYLNIDVRLIPPHVQMNLLT